MVRPFRARTAKELHRKIFAHPRCQVWVIVSPLGEGQGEGVNGGTIATNSGILRHSLPAGRPLADSDTLGFPQEKRHPSVPATIYFSPAAIFRISSAMS